VHIIVENKPVFIYITIINSYTIWLLAAVEIARMAISMHTNSFEQIEDPIPAF
jgi:hypothetical protein